METWYSFCRVPVLHKTESMSPYYPDELEFIFWKGGDFGLCFEQVVIVVFSFTLLALISGYYFGRHGKFFRRKRPSCALTIRGMVAFTLLLNSIALFVGSFWLVPQQPYAVVLAHSVEFIGWLMHLFCLCVLSFSVKHIGYGPLPLNLGWALTLLISLLQFRTSIRYVRYPYLYDLWGEHPLGYLALLVQITSYVRFGCQIVYMVLLFFPAKLVHSTQLQLGGNGFGSTQYLERKPLLLGVQQDAVFSSEDNVDYGTINRIRQRTDLELEDDANFVSLLSFWWLTPLMKSGAYGCLQSPSDLPKLPRSLTTVRVREVFQNTVRRLQRRQQLGHSSSASCDRNLRSLDRLSQYSSQRSISYGAINEEDQEEAYFVLNSSTPPVDDPPITTTHNSWTSFSLIRVLNWSFGLHFYPLGLLKLAGDCLGFAGPLLLHQLVAFIENKNVSLSVLLS